MYKMDHDKRIGVMKCTVQLGINGTKVYQSNIFLSSHNEVEKSSLRHWQIKKTKISTAMSKELFHHDRKFLIRTDLQPTFFPIE